VDVVPLIVYGGTAQVSDGQDLVYLLALAAHLGVFDEVGIPGFLEPLCNAVHGLLQGDILPVVGVGSPVLGFGPSQRVDC